jgi:hypothetical protein
MFKKSLFVLSPSASLSAFYFTSAVRFQTKSIKYIHVRSISRMHLTIFIAEISKVQNFLSPQIGNPPSLGLIPLTQIRNFFGLSANHKSVHFSIVPVR